MKPDKNLKSGLYVSFSQAAKLLKIKPHVLIYWEKKIPLLKPYRIANRKFFKKEQLNLLFKVKTLLNEGYTLEGIRKFLQKEKPKTSQLSLFQERDLKKVLKEVLKDLKKIYEKL